MVHIKKGIPEENSDIESFHNSIKTNYIWINEINNFNDCKIIIEKAFHDYNNIRPHYTLIIIPHLNLKINIKMIWVSENSINYI
ncbi:integrase core domain-containing protein [Acidiplasma sp.]|uniref:integrase core domain-containing protein n=1 Tax=Acidiplasma sp. TaxID=1872114 RepID=UPI00258FD72B|nr:integrase core domain-containing protein [Acidiplasma sp.]